MEYFSELGYIGLFIAAFLAATILPLSSEIIFSTLLMSGLSPTSLLLTATAGNVLGSLTNYTLGYFAGAVFIQKWLRISEADFLHAMRRFNRYGLLSLFFAWVSVIGDPLTLVAGVLRVPLLYFFILVASGKLIRYFILSELILK